MNIYDFRSYKSYLKELIRSRPRRGHGELTKLAHFLRTDPTMMSHVVSGEKQFSLDQAYGACEYFQLSPREVDFFLLLVEKERAGTTALKRHFEKKSQSKLSFRIR